MVWFFQCFGLLVRHFYWFFQCSELLVCHFIGFPMFWVPGVHFLLFFSNVSVFWKPKTLEKPIKTIKTIIFKLSPDGGVAPGDSLKIMVFMVFICFFQCFGLLVRHVYWFLQCFELFVRHFYCFFQCFGLLVCHFYWFFQCFGFLMCYFYWFFQCFGFPACSFYWFFNALRSLGFRDFATV